MSVDPQVYLDKAIHLIMDYGPNLILAIMTLFIGSWFIGLLGTILDRALSRLNFDDTLQPYLVGLSKTLLKVMLYVSVIGMLGVQTTSLIAMLGAAGLAIGMALQGSLGNFAGGVLILVFKPIKKGDHIEACGIEGYVQAIEPFVTIVLSLDNIVYYIPNGELSSTTIKNFSVHPERRVDLTFGISYGASIDSAKEIFTRVAHECPHRVMSKEPEIYVSGLGDSSVDFAVRPYCEPEKYWDVLFYMQENVKKELDKAGIPIPFPQRDVHIHNVKES